ncbi:hypothetical protein ACTFIZ_008765 [Dictyostelium cf. discoideum]
MLLLPNPCYYYRIHVITTESMLLLPNPSWRYQKYSQSIDQLSGHQTNHNWNKIINTTKIKLFEMGPLEIVDVLIHNIHRDIKDREEIVEEEKLIDSIEQSSLELLFLVLEVIRGGSGSVNRGNSSYSGGCSNSVIIVVDSSRSSSCSNTGINITN